MAPAQAGVWYVNAASSATSPDGKTWANAYTDIQAAVNAAAGTNDEVWVAAGTYTGSNSFVVTMTAYVNLYGGFTGTESARAQRNWSANPTIVDGENVRSCVNGAVNATLDGFTLTRGKGSSGGGMSFGKANNCVFTANSAANGGGADIVDATSCSFTGNTANNGYGGGMNNGSAANCTFVGNTASGRNSGGGGGMSRSTAKSCVFTENKANSGGAMYEGSAVNCTFTANTANIGSGGGMYAGTALNCTFIGNTAKIAPNSGGMYQGTATNCILWGNSPTEVGDTAVSYSCLGFATAGVGNKSVDPLFVNPLVGDYRLRAGSPCIDAGSPSGGVTTDQLGRHRPQGAGPDMGAFEYYPGDDAAAVDPPAVLRVNASSTAASPDGLSWETAYSRPQDAADHGGFGTEIWVVSGIYTVLTGSEVLRLNPGTAVYGGFAGTETTRAERNVDNTATVIDGGKARRCIWANPTSLMDGFTIRNGTGYYGGGMSGGRATDCFFVANAAFAGGAVFEGTVEDCTFSGNTASYGGGTYEGTATNCTFAANIASDGYGGGMHDGTAISCTFSGNTASYGGGTYGGTATNCTFTANTSNQGGGMHNGTVTNCTFTGNTASQVGGGTYEGTATNCIIWGNGPDEVNGTAVSYSCLGFATVGAGNLSDNPRFVNLMSGDFRLRADSSCVDVATSSGAPATDQLGRTRPQGPGVDMGAFEYCPGDDVGAVDPPAVLRVNVASTAASPDGLTWETAYSTLQSAADHAGYGTEIWVATGVYTATTGAEVLRLNPGTAVYGGFVGAESARAARGLDNAATVIDGANAMRCITANTTSLVDGLTITNGKSNGGGGMIGGMATNCAFTANSAKGCGGGINGGTATNCTFIANRASAGGGMYFGTAANCTFAKNAVVGGDGGGMAGGTAINCVFEDNKGNAYGGGMSGGSATNCTFAKNTAAWGGGISQGTATNCTFTANTSDYMGGGSFKGTATNCILWGNGPDEVSATSVSYSCLGSAMVGAGNIMGDPRFINPLASDFRLRAGSPCIDSGNAGGAPATDQLGRFRPEGPGVEMGAFEHYPGDDAGAADPPPVLRVNAASTAVYSDGFTWETAYPTLQDAADHGGYGTEIWVATGVYTASKGFQVVRLNPGTAMYGGFAGTESSRAAGGMDHFLTVIDGGNARACITANTVSLVDGFTVANGNSSFGGGMSGGTAVKCAFEANSAIYRGGGTYKATAVNCTFTANTANYGGGIDGGIAMNCTVTGNNTASFGPGGGMCEGAATNCIFWGNKAPNALDGLEVDATSTVAYSCVLGGCTGVGNIDVPPQFADVASGNLRLMAASPCIDSGTEAGAPATDMRGVARPQGAGYDMGAYEFTTWEPVAVSYVANPAEGGTVTGPSTMATGTAAAFRALASAGYLYSSAAATNGTITGTPPDLTLSQVTGDTTVTVTFAPKINTVAYVESPVGGGTLTGPATIATGATAALKVLASAGYIYASASATNGTIAGTVPDLGLSNVTANTTVTAVFRLLSVTVPNVAGQMQAAASASITAAGLTVGAIAQVYSVTVPSGSVVSQAPAAGAAADFGSAVSLTMSKGPETVIVPNVAWQTQDVAQAALTGARLTAGAVIGQCSNTLAAGRVISQSPAAGVQVAPAASVALVLSTGPCPVGGEGEGAPPTREQLVATLAASFDTLDLDKDGRISYAESLAALPGLTQEVFNTLDTDGDGQISQADVALNEPKGCAGCSGGKSAFSPDKMMKAFGDFMLGGLSIIVLLAMTKHRP